MYLKEEWPAGCTDATSTSCEPTYTCEESK